MEDTEKEVLTEVIFRLLPPLGSSPLLEWSDILEIEEKYGISPDEFHEILKKYFKCTKTTFGYVFLFDNYGFILQMLEKAKWPPSYDVSIALLRAVLLMRSVDRGVYLIDVNKIAEVIEKSGIGRTTILKNKVFGTIKVHTLYTRGAVICKYKDVLLAYPIRLEESKTISSQVAYWLSCGFAEYGFVKNVIYSIRHFKLNKRKILEVAFSSLLPLMAYSKSRRILEKTFSEITYYLLEEDFAELHKLPTKFKRRLIRAKVSSDLADLIITNIMLCLNIPLIVAKSTFPVPWVFDDIWDYLAIITNIFALRKLSYTYGISSRLATAGSMIRWIDYEMSLKNIKGWGSAYWILKWLRMLE